MIVWVASFPRSGNTFLRIVLHRLYGIRTSTVYDVDGVAARLGPDLIGFTERPGTLATLRADTEPHFIKTHRRRDTDVHENDPSRYEPELRTKILRQSPTGTGSWGANVLSWLHPPAAHRMVLRYEDLTSDPIHHVTTIVSALAPALTPVIDPAIPSMDELRLRDDRFFRRGHTGSHRDELPPELHELFWSRADNREAMHLLEISR
ncbi:hypothetical protein FB565_007178 [Actinoplanes lutulentus]|uniref:Sulfotransferase domain-containing protein n=1 Tax=Actinoplanes lutulentus TaxID=1287878 RepID=A0A327ZGM0_9ACTN|nr:hypothetical protein [Actinoplanes lutulentus]MBB2947410.1 hypothetical protein [Actinoplanes lutulentus]RAK36684.1 hypothetical protein B0I29_108274 [Actinoplanes lutulentus]